MWTEHPGETVVSWEEHAGPSPSRSLHHCQTRSVLHGAVDRRIRIPEPDQVRDSKRAHCFSIQLNSFRYFFKTWILCACFTLHNHEQNMWNVCVYLSATAFHSMTHFLSVQAAGGHQPAEGGYRATEETAGQEEASQPCVSLPLSGLHLWTQAAQN